MDSNRNHKKKCGIIIPVYNSSQYLSELLERIQTVQKNLIFWQLQLLIVDDGSKPALPEFNLIDLQIKQIRHKKNMGKGKALQTGFRYFLDEQGINPIITMDADLQHLPEYIPEFLKKFEKENSKIIVGYRKRDPKIMPIHRILSNSITSLIISLMVDQSVKDSQCGYRLFDQKVIESLTLTENRFHLESEMLIKSGWKKFKIDFIAIPTVYNSAPSAINNISDTLNFISLILRLTAKRITGHV